MNTMTVYCNTILRNERADRPVVDLSLRFNVPADDLVYHVLCQQAQLCDRTESADSEFFQIHLRALVELARRLGYNTEVVWGMEVPQQPIRRDPFGWLDIRYGQPQF